jgi:hypothetical protein
MAPSIWIKANTTQARQIGVLLWNMSELKGIQSNTVWLRVELKYHYCYSNVQDTDIAQAIKNPVFLEADQVINYLGGVA